ncbi:hypothetical protein H8R18_07015 [Nanchangia anserum]|uniref:sensor histidine kinase n=1 Tax=Nanchangia anserum TaxID=2692125 RepID=UPI00188372CD|nr:ATP-binding protein [Nanchangia anserum]QOX81500.1 hypothetical protein H8R18_07015 [Nanchangia anserum]
MSNAVRYSPDGGRVDVTLTESADEVAIAFTDRGIGIDPSEHRAIFRRFYRVDPARSRASGGTGLGLSIVTHVVHDHRGDISLDSELGRGATFTITLPRLPGSPHSKGMPT